MSSTPELRKAFVARLVQACDQSPTIPPMYQGRQQYIAERLGIAPEAVSKWFKGGSMPRPAKMEDLAALLGVDIDWLARGSKVEMDSNERKVHGLQSSGAALLVRALFLLAGAQCADPTPTDPRAKYVDFYVLLGGQAKPVRVSLARDREDGGLEVGIIREYLDVQSVAVVQLPGEKFHFLSLELPMIEKHKVKRGGEFLLTMQRLGTDKYNTDGDTWPRIRQFREMI